jgi:hypothetical protein
MRTMTLAAPTMVLPTRASILTSPSLVLGWPNLPAVKNETLVPFTGSVSVSVGANAPVVPLRNPTEPPFAADVLESLTDAFGPAAPAGLVTRIRHGDGAHETNCALGFVLLLICSSTFIIMPSNAGDELGGILRQRAPASGAN